MISIFISGFLSWDSVDCHVDLEKELQALTAQAPEGEEARHGELTYYLIIFPFLFKSRYSVGNSDFYDCQKALRMSKFPQQFPAIHQSQSNFSWTSVFPRLFFVDNTSG